MRVGTKSLLFGAHQFIIHPLFVFAAWWRLYGLPGDPRLWIAFIIHDWGYWGLPNMDGHEGNLHPILGAKIMHLLFDHPRWIKKEGSINEENREWYNLCLYHSRFLAKDYGSPFSRLCVADKLSIVLEPAWLYLPRVRWSGEIREYMALAKKRTLEGEPKYASMKVSTDSQERWFYDVQEYLMRWISEHKDFRKDTWTPCIKTPNSDSGVWK